MTTSVMIVGIDPQFLHLPDDALGVDATLTAESIRSGLERSAAHLRQQGHSASIVLTDLGQTAVDTVTAALRATPADVVVIGAGIRMPAKNTALLERLVNAVIEVSPTSRLAFNIAPDDSEVARRALALSAHCPCRHTGGSWSVTGGATGALPRSGRAESCSHALPASRRVPRRSPPVSSASATRSCPPSTPWTAASACP